jgi:hypothetical protein
MELLVPGGGLISGAAKGAGYTIASSAVLSYLMGTYNPHYKKQDRKRMRYIQRKYAMAYGGGVTGEDAGAIIHQIDPSSKLLMTDDGAAPLNPYNDESAFDDALIPNFHPVSGHQGRFVGSHAMPAIGCIIDYQTQRRERFYVPGVLNPGRPNGAFF